MEIERKYLIDPQNLPKDFKNYPCRIIEQGYLCTDPVVRIRMDNNDYFLTYKSKGCMVREEFNLPLTKKAYFHLKAKTDGIIIRKDRYMLPLDGNLVIELDLFKEELEPLILAEVEFPDEASANSFSPPAWFGRDVTFCPEFHNSALSRAKEV